MPRRNVYLLLLLTLVGLISSANVSRHGRDLLYAMGRIEELALDDPNKQQLFEGAMQGMMDELDDFSEYIRPAQITEFEQSLNRQFDGVGIEILLDPDTKQLVVTSPVHGSPAFKAGVRAGDRIIRINGESTQGLSLEDASQRMRGRPGTSVTLSVLHVGETEPIDLEIVREIIQADTVLGDTRYADGSWNYFLEGTDRVGYLRLNTFAYRTADELRKALDWLVERGVKGLILDVRNNPGGALDAAIEIADMFVVPKPGGPTDIVTTRGRGGKVLAAFPATEDGTYRGFPIAVLVNQYSASASEIVAACLQDYGVAVVVGERSYGKGTIQQLLALEDGLGELKLTTASYWRPSGKNIHRARNADEADDWGVRPDKGFEVKVAEKEMAELLRLRLQRDGYRPERKPGDKPDYLRDPQLTRAVEYINGKKNDEGRKPNDEGMRKAE